jgi:hypothetical protein
MPSSSPTLAQLLNRAKAELSAEVRVALPCSVERWDPSTNTVDVKPQVQETHETEDGSLVSRALPVLPSVPVIFPGAGGMRITFPIQAGDTGLAIFSDRSIDAWCSAGGDTAPVDQRRHHLSDAVFIPGLRPSSKAWSSDPAVLTLGSDTGAADFVATAQRVLTELNKLKTAFDAHTHTVATTGTSTAQTGTAAAPASSPALSSPASATVKVKG